VEIKIRAETIKTLNNSKPQENICKLKLYKWIFVLCINPLAVVTFSCEAKKNDRRIADGPD